MAKFFVGQRVRVIGVDGDDAKHALGATGVISGGAIRFPDYFRVTMDCPELHAETFSEGAWIFAEHQLEPITDIDTWAREQVAKLKETCAPKDKVAA